MKKPNEAATMPSTSNVTGNNTECESEPEDLSPEISEYEPSSEDASDEDPQKGKTVNVKHLKPDVANKERKIIGSVTEDEISDLLPVEQRKLEGIGVTPTKTDNPRKHLRHPEQWARNVSEVRRELGEAYV
ncbi:hypothetical protein PR048_019747 [Dryococelus australis]|uniref:Uncharacterized protein n=1 Tax=Dryococelus australis TaxID=614101 RepID=A0ABQ9H4L6_9NEOP|nr:hypothetical protein PR048_019747 [Dryococelus australis]